MFTGLDSAYLYTLGHFKCGDNLLLCGKGFYLKDPFYKFVEMKKTTDKKTVSKVHQSEFRCNVQAGNTFQLPARLVNEVGFKGPLLIPGKSAQVAWYYHEKHDKAVLANDMISRESLKPVKSCSLNGVSNEDLESGDVQSARVKIITELPDSLFERLTQDHVVLKPIYASNYTQLNHTCVSVYPGKEYDNGELQNVCMKRTESIGDKGTSSCKSNIVKGFNQHNNSV